MSDAYVSPLIPPLSLSGPLCLQLILNSMHKYQPRVHVVKTTGEKDQLRDFPPSTAGSDSFSTHIFVETQFMGVTAYQNQQVRYHPFLSFFLPPLYLLCLFSFFFSFLFYSTVVTVSYTFSFSLFCLSDMPHIYIYIYIYLLSLS